MRTFIALDLDPPIRQKIAEFLEAIRGFAPDVRWMKPESLHVTLKFLGDQSQERVKEIEQLLSQIPGESFELSFRGYGFFPNANSARVFWIGIETGPKLADLAAEIDKAIARLGIPREEHTFSPHLTLARAGSGVPNRQKGDKPNLRFQQLQPRLSTFSACNFGTMSAREFFLYESKLLRDGPQYNKIARVALALKDKD
jgi:2'-5' RNA ligase